MRQTCIGAIGTNVRVRLPLIRARVWAMALSLGLLCADAHSAAASSDLHLTIRFLIQPSYQPGPRTHSVRDVEADSTLPIPSAATLYSETYWTAFADLDLMTLRNAARTAPESRFADAMTLLAAGNFETAETAFIAVSRQLTDLNVAVAAQVMLASTLRYERKWSQLRDLPLTSTLNDQDKLITSDLERWGKAFADVEPEVMKFPAEPIVMPLRTTAVGTPIIRVRINGKLYDFWLDTGSSMTVVSSAVAKDAKIAALSDDTLTVRTFAGSAPVRPASVKRIEIGSIVIANCPAVIIEESLMYLRATGPVAATTGLQVDGIIGWDLIRQLDLVMDYAGGRIVLAEPASNGIAGTTRQNLVWLGKPLVEVRTKGGGMLHFTLDTGAQSSFLNATVLDKTGASSKSSDNRVYGIARTGRETNRVVPFLAVDVGGKSLRLQDVIVYGPAPSGLINTDGILGTDVGRFGAIHIDATNGIFTIGDSDRLKDPAE
jgi:predicted aspartyl protease